MDIVVTPSAGGSPPSHLTMKARIRYAANFIFAETNPSIKALRI